MIIMIIIIINCKISKTIRGKTKKLSIYSFRSTVFLYILSISTNPINIYLSNLSKSIYIFTYIYLPIYIMEKSNQLSYADPVIYASNSNNMQNNNSNNNNNFNNSNFNNNNNNNNYSYHSLPLQAGLTGPGQDAVPALAATPTRVVQPLEVAPVGAIDLEKIIVNNERVAADRCQQHARIVSDQERERILRGAMRVQERNLSDFSVPIAEVNQHSHRTREQELEKIREAGRRGVHVESLYEQRYAPIDSNMNSISNSNSNSNSNNNFGDNSNDNYYYSATSQVGAAAESDVKVTLQGPVISSSNHQYKQQQQQQQQQQRQGQGQVHDSYRVHDYRSEYDNYEYKVQEYKSEYDP